MGYVDTTTCQELTKTIKDLISQNRIQIIADLGGVNYISSAGWGVFVGEIKNIQDRGGDLKIVQMTPEVFEVFEMLEFNRILNYYESIEEAIDEFDIIRGIDITRIDKEVRRNTRGTRLMPEAVRSPLIVEEKRKVSAIGGKLQSKISPKDFPLMEKVKMVVLENPFWGILTIRKQLNTEKYGSVKIGFLKLRSVLKELNLNNKEERYRFYRSR
jgi:anti-sigma B factor antagonist